MSAIEQRKQDFAILVEFILAQADLAPLSTRIPVYRALANLIGNPAAGAHLSQIAEQLQHIEDQYQQFEFMLQKPLPPTKANGETGK